MRSDFRQLRKKFDGSDPFMTGGHQIIKSAGATRHAERVSKTPDWVRDDKKVRALLLRSFPKLKTSSTQRKRAARWIRIIQLYFRMGWPEDKVAGELQISIDLFRYYIRAIQWAAQGKTVNNTVPTGRAKGRPRKISL